MRKATSTKPTKKRGTKTTPYDVAAYLNCPEDMGAYLNAWLNEAPDDAAGIARALGNIARAKALGVRLHAGAAT
jgi:DNA-binding phage protein